MTSHWGWRRVAEPARGGPVRPARGWGGAGWGVAVVQERAAPGWREAGCTGSRQARTSCRPVRVFVCIDSSICNGLGLDLHRIAYTHCGKNWNSKTVINSRKTAAGSLMRFRAPRRDRGMPGGAAHDIRGVQRLPPRGPRRGSPQRTDSGTRFNSSGQRRSRSRPSAGFRLAPQAVR